MSNQLQYVHEWLWAALEADPEFRELVPEPRRLKLSLFCDPALSANISEADTPMVGIFLNKIDFHPDAATNLTLVHVTFAVQLIIAGVNTRDVARLIWTIAKRLIEVRPNLLNDPNIYDCVLMESETKYVVSGRIGTLTVCLIQIDIKVPTATLRNTGG